MTHVSRGRSRRYVLDANALISFVEERPGSALKVRDLMAVASQQDTPLMISAVNWGEVFYIAWRHHGEARARETEARLLQMPIVVIGVERERAIRAAALKQKHGLGFADAFAAELAMERGAWLVTADPEFAKLGKGLLVYSLPRHG